MMKESATELAGFQKKYLRGLAHGLKPIVYIGHKGLTESVAAALDQALLSHELVKAKFIDDKDKPFKTKTLKALEKAVGADVVGMIGHIAIFYRPNPDPQKRRISIPRS